MNLTPNQLEVARTEAQQKLALWQEQKLAPMRERQAKLVGHLTQKQQHFPAMILDAARAIWKELQPTESSRSVRAAPEVDLDTELEAMLQGLNLGGAEVGPTQKATEPKDQPTQKPVESMPTEAQDQATQKPAESMPTEPQKDQATQKPVESVPTEPQKDQATQKPAESLPTEPQKDQATLSLGKRCSQSQQSIAVLTSQAPSMQDNCWQEPGA